MNLAHILTLMNALFGVISIILSFKGYLVGAVFSIYFGMVFDFFDGKVARMQHTTSQLGKRLDSIADCITFGIAPIVLVCFSIHSAMHWFIMISLVGYLLCACFRLIRYSIEEKDAENESFQGLPVPVSAGCIISFILIFCNLKMDIPVVLIGFIIIVCSILMLSNIPYKHVSTILNGRLLTYKYLIVLFVIIGAVIRNYFFMLFVGFSTYLLWGPVSQVFFKTGTNNRSRSKIIIPFKK